MAKRRQFMQFVGWLTLLSAVLVGCKQNTSSPANASPAVAAGHVVFQQLPYRYVASINELAVYWLASETAPTTLESVFIEHYATASKMLSRHLKLTQPALYCSYGETNSITSEAGQASLACQLSDVEQLGLQVDRVFSQLILNHRIHWQPRLTLAEHVIRLGFNRLLTRVDWQAHTPSLSPLAFNELDDQQQQLIDTLISHYFAEDFDPQLWSGAAVNQLAERWLWQYLESFPGSNIFNIITLPATQFKSLLDANLHAPLFRDAALPVSVKTPDIDNQIAVATLARQAAEFSEHYFLQGPGQRRLIALTFDDGPSNYTAQILDKLALYQVPASFFWQGANMLLYRDTVKRAAEAGHTIANHSWNHANFTGYSNFNELVAQQIELTNQTFLNQLAYIPRMIRPPYGEITDAQITELANLGYKLMLWSVDTRDWHPGLNAHANLEATVINHGHEEAIVLMHDSGGDRSNTVTALDNIITHYQSLGYQFVTLEQLFGWSNKF